MTRARGDPCRTVAPAAATSSPASSSPLFGAGALAAVPVMPVEIMFCCRAGSRFISTKVSYWSRTVIAPLLVLMAEKPRARNPRGVKIDELFLEPPQQLGMTG